MKQKLKKLIILSLCIFSTATVLAQADDADKIKYTDGNISLVSGKGKLYMYADSTVAQKHGYKKIYYLFTENKKLTFDITSNWKSNISRVNEDSDSKWNKKGTNGETRLLEWSIEELNQHKDLALEWEHSAQLRFEAGKGEQSDPSKTVLLVAMPALDQAPLKSVSVEYDGKSYDANIFADSVNIEPGQTHGNIVIERGIGIVIDSILVGGGKIREDSLSYNPEASHDSPLKPEMTITAPFRVNYKEGDSIDAVIYYKKFADNGNIVPESKSFSIIKPHSDSDNGNTVQKIMKILKWIFIIVLIIGVSIIFVVFIEWMKWKRKNKSSESNFFTCLHKFIANLLSHNRVNDGVAPPENGNGNNNNTQDNDNNNTDNTVDNETEPNRNPEPKDLSNDANRRAKDLEKANIDLQQKLNAAEKRKNELNEKIQELNRQIEKANEKVKNAEENANKKAQNRIKQLQSQLDAANKCADEADRKAEEKNNIVKADYDQKLQKSEQAKKEAELRAETAEQRATEKAQKDVEKVKQACEKRINDIQTQANNQINAAREDSRIAINKANTAIQDAQNNAKKEIQNAKNEADKAIKAKEDECNNRVANWQADKAKVNDLLEQSMKQLSNQLSAMANDIDSTSPIGSNFLTVVKGAAKYSQIISNNIANAWSKLTTSECLESMRNDTEALLQNTGSWINLLCRFSCYSDVPALNDIMASYGLNRGDIKSAYTSLQRILGLIGISLVYPILSLDCGDDEYIRNNFVMDTSIDRVSNMFAGGNMMVMRSLIPDNEGQKIVYELGQVAYTTVADGIIHKGKIIFY